GNSVRHVTCLKGDKDGSMWLGSLGAGLMRWRKGELAIIGGDAGLPALNVHGIVEDTQGFFWMPSNRGVMRVRRSDLQSVADSNTRKLVGQLLDQNDGLVGLECPYGQQPTCARDANGRLWFATVKGVAMIDPSLFSNNTVAPLVNIEEVDYHLTTRAAGG